MTTHWVPRIFAGAALGGLMIGSAAAQSGTASEQAKREAARPTQVEKIPAAPGEPAPTGSITPPPKPSVEQLSGKSIVPLPSAGGAGVSPPAMPGAPNAAPPGAGSRPQ